MRTTTVVLATAGILLALTSCSSDTADPGACKAAMAKQLDKAVDAGDQAKPGTRPAACDGVDDKTLQRLAGEAATEQAGKTVDEPLDASTTPEPASALPPECRTWLEAELLDASDTIDAEAGQAVCGDLSDTEMDQAIEDITNDLTKP